MQTMLTRAVGAQPGVEMDVEEHSISNGDTFLLCSDGLSRMVSDEIIAGVIQNSENAQSAADRLVELAREAGGLDNGALNEGHDAAVVLDLDGNNTEAVYTE